METVTLKMHGKAADGSSVYRSYYLIIDGGRLAGRGRATAVPMSSQAPMPEQDFVEVQKGGEEEAIAQLINTLLALEGNQGLIAELNDRPS